MSPYVFSESSLVDEQMRGISETFDAVTADRLNRIGVQPGSRCLEIGAGNGSVAEMLAELTGPTGHVVATEIDASHVRPAGAPNVEFRHHDITTDPLPDGEYDLVHARLVLMHLPDRLDVLRRLWRTLRPGGVLLTEDYAFGVLPPVSLLPDSDGRYAAMLTAVHRLFLGVGADPDWGVRAYTAFADAGFTGVSADHYARAWPSGSPGCELFTLHVRQLRDPLLATGLLTESALDAFMDLVTDPRFALLAPPMIGTWGRRPA